jgi:hypothetical protein
MLIILFTCRAPNPITHALSLQGHTSLEALAISEVHALAGENITAQVVITSDVDSKRAKIIQQHYSTFQMSAESTAADLIFELSGKPAYTWFQ